MAMGLKCGSPCLRHIEISFFTSGIIAGGLFRVSAVNYAEVNISLVIIWCVLVVR